MEKGPVYGMWSILNSPPCIEILAETGLEFVILDGEHGNFSPRDFEDLVRVSQSCGIEPVVRVSGPNQIEIQKVLDCGVGAVLVPQIKSASQVANVVSACRLSPHGTRGFNPFTRAGHYRGDSQAVLHQSATVLIGVLIENRQAIEDIDAILGVEGLGLVYIGVYDLSCSLDVAGDTEHPTVQSAVALVVSKAKERGIAIGMMIPSRHAAASFISMGARFLVLKPDTSVFFSAVKGLLEE